MTVTTITNSTSFNFSGAGTQYESLSGESITVVTEAAAQQIIRSTLTAAKLFVYAAQNTLNASVTVRTRKNGSNGNLSILIPSSTTGAFEDLTHSDSLATGDKYCFQGVSGGGSSGIISTSMMSCTLAHATDGISYPNASVSITSAGTNYTAILGFNTPRGTEADTYFTFRFVTTLSHLWVNVAANAGGSGSQTVTVRKNAGAGNETVSILHDTSGQFEDTTHSDTVASGDNVDFQIITIASTLAFTANIAVQSDSPNRPKAPMLCTPGSPAAPSNATTYCIPMCDNVSSTEALVQLKAEVTCDAKQFFINIVTNDVALTSTAKSRLNGADGVMIVSIPSTTTGIFEDTTHFDHLAAGALFNYAVVIPNSGTGILIISVGYSTDDIVRSITGANLSHASSLSIGHKALRTFANYFDPTYFDPAYFSVKVTGIKMSSSFTYNFIAKVRYFIANIAMSSTFTRSPLVLQRFFTGNISIATTLTRVANKVRSIVTGTGMTLSSSLSHLHRIPRLFLANMNLSATLSRSPILFLRSFTGNMAHSATVSSLKAFFITITGANMGMSSTLTRRLKLLRSFVGNISMSSLLILPHFLQITLSAAIRAIGLSGITRKFKLTAKSRKITLTGESQERGEVD